MYTNQITLNTNNLNGYIKRLDLILSDDGKKAQQKVDEMREVVFETRFLEIAQALDPFINEKLQQLVGRVGQWFAATGKIAGNVKNMEEGISRLRLRRFFEELKAPAERRFSRTPQEKLDILSVLIPDLQKLVLEKYFHLKRPEDLLPESICLVAEADKSKAHESLKTLIRIATCAIIEASKLSLHTLNITEAEKAITFAKDYGEHLKYLDVFRIRFSIQELGKFISYFPRLNSLIMRECKLDSKSGAVLARAENLKKLRLLNLQSNRLGDQGVRELTGAESVLGTVTDLNLRGNRIGHDGAAAIANPDSCFNELDTLNLDLNQITHLGLSALLGEDSSLSKLSSLSLRNNDIGPEGAQTLAHSKQSKKLRHLNLRNNDLGDQGVVLLAKRGSPLENLCSLNLRSTGISNLAVISLAGPDSVLGGLVELNLAHNRLSNESISTLAGLSSSLKKLNSLNLGGNLIRPDSVATIAGPESCLSELVTLKLKFCFLGDKGAAELACTSRLKKLKTLDVRINGITETGKAALNNPESLLKGTTLYIDL